MATVEATSSSCETAASEIQYLPPGNEAGVATRRASRDLPTPPRPATVTRPGPRIAASSKSASASRPKIRRGHDRQPRGPGRAARAGVAERGEVDGHGLRIGVNAKLIGEQAPAHFVGSHHPGPVAGPVQGPDQDPVRPFVERAGRGSAAASLGGPVVIAERPSGPGKDLQCVQGERVGLSAVRVQPAGILPRQQLIAGELGDRLGGCQRRLVPALVGQIGGGPQNGAGVSQVDLDAGSQRVPRRRGRDDLLSASADPGQRGPQRPHHAAQRGRPGRRRLIGPQNRGQPVGGHRPAGQRECGERDPGSPAAEVMAGHDQAVATGRHGPDDADPHPAGADRPGAGSRGLATWFVLDERRCRI